MLNNFKFSVHKVWAIGLFLGLSALVIHHFGNPQWIERVYGKGIFPMMRLLLDETVGRIPFAMSWLVFPGLVAGLLLILYKFLAGADHIAMRGLSLLLRLAGYAGWIIFVFYSFWGFNYDRLTLDERMPWNANPVEKNDFIAECIQQASTLSSIRMEEEKLIDHLTQSFDFDELEVKIRSQACDIAAILDYTRKGRMQCRQLIPDGILLRLSTAGFYNPFTGECNIDRALHPLQKPFVMAHEFFHALGVTGEGDCNFLAYVLCSTSQDPFTKYSGELVYWRYLRRQFQHTDPDAYDKTMEGMNQLVHEDLRQMDERIRKYPDFAPRFRDAFYDAYLKSNKIEEGMANYRKIVQLVINWRENQRELN